MKLLERVSAATRVRHFFLATERIYIYWIRKYIYFNNKQHPESLGPKDVSAFPTYLAVKQKVAVSTQNQALCALVFLCRYVLGKTLELNGGFQLAKRPRRLPTVLSKEEVRSLLSNLTGTNKLIATLMYGSGMRKLETLRLRVCDFSLERKEIMIIKLMLNTNGVHR